MRFALRNFGPVKQADIRFGDLTVFVGPQATGKSVTLQLMKLLVDTGAVQQMLGRYGFEWDAAGPGLMDLYFGEGMHQLFTRATRVGWDGRKHGPRSLARRRKGSEAASVYYVPAQRVLSLTQGWPKPFGEFSAGDPYVLREFSERVRVVAEQLARAGDVLFPREQRLKEPVRKALSREIFGGFSLNVERNGRKRLMLGRAGAPGLPVTAWSTGQREFVPMLLALLELLPSKKKRRLDDVSWVVLEELEAGLHPRGITTCLVLLLELLNRGYRVCLSTHSSTVVDLLWAVHVFRQKGGVARDVLALFDEPAAAGMTPAAQRMLELDIRVHHFGQDGHVQDISALDPGAIDEREGTWGGLTGFASSTSDVVSRVAARAWRQGA
ncbi:MAG: AAA family ATPase [Deltaproteobacteria bacterium]|nr:AAA family ATPase [Deltaproteobacteria bacterium]